MAASHETIAYAPPRARTRSEGRDWVQRVSAGLVVRVGVRDPELVSGEGRVRSSSAGSEVLPKATMQAPV